MYKLDLGGGDGCPVPEVHSAHGGEVKAHGGEEQATEALPSLDIHEAVEHARRQVIARGSHSSGCIMRVGSPVLETWRGRIL